MAHVDCTVGLEEGVLRVLYEGPATVCECAAGLLRFGYATEAATGEIERQLHELERRACVERAHPPAQQRYAITPAGSERLAVIVEAA